MKTSFPTFTSGKRARTGDQSSSRILIRHLAYCGVSDTWKEEIFSSAAMLCTALCLLWHVRSWPDAEEKYKQVPAQRHSGYWHCLSHTGHSQTLTPAWGHSHFGDNISICFGSWQSSSPRFTMLWHNISKPKSENRDVGAGPQDLQGHSTGRKLL